MIPILQKLSHSTRAYIWTANGLVGFLEPFNDIIPLLEDAEDKGILEEATKW